jgi:hypothetical protein
VSAPAAAQSEWFARVGNESGGEIVLLTGRGTCPEKFLRAFATDPSGKIVWGCWALSSTHVHVVYETGAERAYQAHGWTINPAFQTQQPSQQRQSRKPEVVL